MRVTSTLEGATRTRMLLDGTAAAVAAREGDRHVASIVFYGPYQEWGTRKLAARPHWRPAAREIRARGISTRHLAARTAGGRFTVANTPGVACRSQPGPE